MADDYREKFWSALGEVRTGMLALTGGGEAHALPMTAHFADEHTLFFFAPPEGKLAEGAGGGSRAAFYYAGPSHALFATVHGALAVSDDAETRRRFWSDEVERWFPGGRDDPAKAALLRFDPEQAKIWLPGGAPGDASVFDFASKPVDRHETVSL